MKRYSQTEQFYLDDKEYCAKDLVLTRAQIDSMSDEELEKHNELIRQWTAKVARHYKEFVYSKYTALEYAYRRYKELKQEGKDKHPMWRSRGMVELYLMETGLKITKFTQGFTIHLGDIDKDLFYLEITFKKGELFVSNWYRSYNKTKTLTPEELTEQEKERLKQLEKQYMNNYKKLGLNKTQFGKTYEIDDAHYTIIGVNPRNKKFPVKCKMVHLTDDNKSGLYDVSLSYLKRMKLVKTDKSK